MNIKIKFPKSKKSFRKKDSAIHPERYWHIILCVSFLFVLASCAFAFYFYVNITKEVFVTKEEASLQMPAVKGARIFGAIEYFKNKENVSRDILVSPAPVIDPSI